MAVVYSPTPADIRALEAAIAAAREKATAKKYKAEPVQ